MESNRTDDQTGLPSRAAFCEDVRRRLAECHRHGTRLSVMLVEIDGGDQLVATHGPALEEILLRTCTQFFHGIMRDMDLVARYGPRVFAILMPSTPLVYAAGAGDRLRQTVARSTMQMQGQEIAFTLSAGLAEAQRGDDVKALLTRAEDALKGAVASGGNTVRFHTGGNVDAWPKPAAHAQAT